VSIVVHFFPSVAYPIVFLGVSCLLILLFVFAVRQLKLGRMDFVTTRLGVIFCLLMMVTSFVMHQFIHTLVEYEHGVFAIGSLIRNSVVVANVLVIVLIESLIRQNEKSRFLILQKFQSEMQQNHITQLADNLAERRLMSHDFRHSIEMIHSLFSVGKENELRAYLSALSSKKPTVLTLDTGNVMVDAVLTSKKAEAVSNNIDFTLKMDIPQGLPNMSIEICTLLGNALDNAIEACERSLEKCKFIIIEIRATETQFLCRIINTIGEKPKPNGKFLATSKPDNSNHGIGLKSMKQTCDNLGGDLSFEYNDTQFELQIYIPIII
ncbi:MAG: ATP-binding protein, partial [Defluviitaleaceae bacterium]|nr:ATP-binding protein [Defluviitaleaceae bacterium]